MHAFFVLAFLHEPDRHIQNLEGSKSVGWEYQRVARKEVGITLKYRQLSLVFFVKPIQLYCMHFFSRFVCFSNLLFQEVCETERCA